MAEPQEKVREFAGIPFLAKPLVERHQGTTVPLFRGCALQTHLPCTTPPPEVSEAEEVKGGQRRTPLFPMMAFQ
jgi:hypothetical protein